MLTLLRLCSLLLSFKAFGQTQPPIDLQLTFEADPPMPWVVGQVGETRLRVTNLSTTHAARARIAARLNIFDRRIRGASMSDTQATLILTHFAPSFAVVLADGDAAGVRMAESALAQLAPALWIR